MELKINNKLITTPIVDIVKRVRHDCSYDLFRDMMSKGDNLQVTCPFHGNGQERHPSCFIYQNYDGDMLPGMLHCFTCDARMPIWSWVGKCFDEDDDFGKHWLTDNFADIFLEQELNLPEIDLGVKKKVYMDESILQKYRYYHPYMYKRKLTDSIIEKFDIGWDPDTDSITFPFRDIKGNLLGVSKRSTSTKNFFIPSNIDKPVYLLNTVVKENHEATIVCESQIDALYAWSLGYVAVAMIGTGASNQYEILNKCPVRHYVLMFDGDPAGKNGIRKFKSHIRTDVLVDTIILPTDKDINDLTKQEFIELLEKNNVENCLRIS